MNRRAFILPVVVTGLIGLSAFGCSDDNTPAGPGMGTARVQLTDAPAAYDAVNLVVTEVSINRETDSDDGWEVLNATPATYDLLELRNGVFTTIGAALVPAGQYHQVRLKLGSGSTIVVDGVTHPLVVPSGSQSGLKLVGDFTVPPQGLVDVGLDFDADRSVHVTGNGTYMLSPVIRMFAMTATGAIHGRALPEGTATTVTALQGSETIASTTTASDGNFVLSLLAPGVYSVAFHAESGYRDTTITDVTVNAGETTEIGDVTLTPQ